MAIRTGATGGLTFRGQVVSRCRGWELSINKDALEDTCLGTFDREYIEGLRGATGSTTILYDPDDSVAVPLLNRILQNEEDPDAVGLVLNTPTNQKLDVAVLITSQSTPMQVGEIVAVAISFQVTGPIVGSY